MRRQFVLVVPLAMAASLCLTGCCYYELRNTINTAMINAHCSWQAHKAWYQCSDSYGDRPCCSAFGDGFRDGYAEVCSGGDGIAPTLPPRSYWGDCFTSGNGKQQVTAYFNGFSQGAYRAQMDGCGGGGHIPVRQLVCPTPPLSMGAGYGGTSGMYGTPMGSSVVLPPDPTVQQVPNAPPPAPPAGGPRLSPDPPYESYDPSGLYDQ